MSKEILSALKQVEKKIDREVKKRNKYSKSRSERWQESDNAEKYNAYTERLDNLADGISNLIFDFELVNSLR